MAEPAQLTLELPTHRAAALAWGDPGAPVVVALHGFPDTAWAWREVGPLLAAEGWRVVAPFARGYAPSELPADGCFDVPALMADAVAVHAAVDAGTDAVLVGHDWGAITANGLAAHPDTPYAATVALSVPPIGAMPTPGPAALARQAWRSRYIAFHQLPVLPERTLHQRVPGLWARWSPGFDATDDLAHVRAALDTPARQRAAIETYRGLTRPWRVPAAYRTWARTWTGVPRGPYRYLHGADDGCMGPDLVTGLGEIVAGAGHFVPQERPDAVAAAVRALGSAG
ncbi:alpha/beta fold hydrolase [Nocardioides massiliensis]|uniref:Pimeloyl-ACP methyl ester carboxylesterase n=1 Tax=Nocardioides massiliensis TaxID=1325935 RepID=A0ABT9NUV0_9ACTN|nr:alpha/beta fold hydrolase [Nocardioides massiliensis]MDP9824212.1 pimeloyl-ACP methyl ester carboxylesterase [Nocardioides massiliensis]